MNSTRANKGYAFVNFTTVEAANNASKEMHRRKWVIFNSKKVARVCSARVQVYYFNSYSHLFFSHRFANCYCSYFLLFIFSPKQEVLKKEI